jgi:hypothetical protein
MGGTKQGRHEDGDTGPNLKSHSSQGVLGRLHHTLAMGTMGQRSALCGCWVR